MERTFPKDSTFYIIPDLINYECIRFYYIPEQFIKCTKNLEIQDHGFDCGWEKKPVKILTNGRKIPAVNRKWMDYSKLAIKPRKSQKRKFRKSENLIRSGLSIFYAFKLIHSRFASESIVLDMILLVPMHSPVMKVARNDFITMSFTSCCVNFRSR